MFRPGIVGMRGSTVILLRPCMTIEDTPPPLHGHRGLFKGQDTVWYASATYPMVGVAIFRTIFFSRPVEILKYEPIRPYDNCEYICLLCCRTTVAHSSVGRVGWANECVRSHISRVRCLSSSSPRISQSSAPHP